MIAHNSFLNKKYDMKTLLVTRKSPYIAGIRVFVLIFLAFILMATSTLYTE